MFAKNRSEPRAVCECRQLKSLFGIHIRGWDPLYYKQPDSSRQGQVQEFGTWTLVYGLWWVGFW